MTAAVVAPAPADCRSEPAAEPESRFASAVEPDLRSEPAVEPVGRAGAGAGAGSTSGAGVPTTAVTIPALPHPGLAPGGGWTPTAPCGLHCLPAPTSAAVPWLRFAAMAGIVVLAVLGTPLLTRRTRGYWLGVFSRSVLRAAGVQLRVSNAAGLSGATDSTGAAPGAGSSAYRAGGGVLVVANHRSWIDVLALGAVAPVRLLAKSDVRDWPLIGRLASSVGALYVDRSSLRTLPATVADMAQVLRDGDPVAVFPEGSTWCGMAAGPFRRAAFQAAIDAGVPVQPVAITLCRPDGSAAPEATFVGDQGLVDSVLRVLRSPGLVCELTVLPAIAPDADRQVLAQRATDMIAQVTAVPHPPYSARSQPAPADGIRVAA